MIIIFIISIISTSWTQSSRFRDQVVRNKDNRQAVNTFMEGSQNMLWQRPQLFTKSMRQTWAGEAGTKTAGHTWVRLSPETHATPHVRSLIKLLCQRKRWWAWSDIQLWPWHCPPPQTVLLGAAQRCNLLQRRFEISSVWSWSSSDGMVCHSRRPSDKCWELRSEKGNRQMNRSLTWSQACETSALMDEEDPSTPEVMPNTHKLLSTWCSPLSPKNGTFVLK